jgi:hypothetical protein
LKIYEIWGIPAEFGKVFKIRCLELLEVWSVFEVSTRNLSEICVESYWKIERTHFSSKFVNIEILNSWKLKSVAAIAEQWKA